MHSNIPIFIPHLACHHSCVFCNQNSISGTQQPPSVEETDFIIKNAVNTIKESENTQIAFFGGSFTGLSR